MVDLPLNGGEGGAGGLPAHASATTGSGLHHAGLVEFAAAIKAGLVDGSTGKTAISEEAEGAIREVAETGAADIYPWDDFRLLLARKIEIVLGEFWRDSQDVEVQ